MLQNNFDVSALVEPILNMLFETAKSAGELHHLAVMESEPTFMPTSDGDMDWDKKGDGDSDEDRKRRMRLR